MKINENLLLLISWITIRNGKERERMKTKETGGLLTVNQRVPRSSRGGGA